MKASTYLFMPLLLAAVLLSVLPVFGEDPVFPPDDVVPGWKTAGPIREFNSNGLYGHIDGGSELFLEFGFDVLRLQKYRDTGGSEEITVETYKMTSPEAALAIYLMKCGPESPVAGIEDKVRHTGDSHQIMLLKGHYFVTVNSFTGNDPVLAVMVRLANRTLEKIPAAAPADLFSLLPLEDRVPGSEMLFRGPYSLEAIFTFGEGDVFLLNNKIFGAAAQYRYKKADPSGASPEIYNRLVIRYPDITSCQKAFSHLTANLDSYIHVQEQRKDHLVFKDYRDKVGIITLKNDCLYIEVNLPSADR